jgi:hypothetical protein
MQPRSGPFIGMDHNALAHQQTVTIINRTRRPGRKTGFETERDAIAQSKRVLFYLWVQIASVTRCVLLKCILRRASWSFHSDGNNMSAVTGMIAFRVCLLFII